MKLSPGDTVAISVTHQVRIDDEPAWIRLEIDSKVQPDEHEADAVARVNSLIQKHIIKVIEDSAKTVVDYNAK